MTDKKALAEQMVEAVFAELRAAEEKHPSFPSDPFEAVAIVTEEVGELARAILKQKHEGGSIVDIEREAIQTAAMALRFLFEFDSFVLAPGAREGVKNV